MTKIKNKRKVLCLVLLSTMLHGCIGGTGSDSTSGNQTQPSNYLGDGAPGAEHTKPDKDQIKDKEKRKKELYEKLKNHGTASVNQRNEIDKILSKLPLHLLDAHAERDGTIEFVTGDWSATLQKYGVNTDEKFVDYTSTSLDQETKTIGRHSLAHAIVANDKLKLLVRADDGINYANNGDNRKRLYYAALKSLFAIDNAEIDGEFVSLLQDGNKAGINRYLDHPGVKELLALNNNDEAKLNNEYHETAENNLAYLLANYADAPEIMINIYPQMAKYLDKFNHEYFEDANLNEISQPHQHIECRSGACGVALNPSISAATHVLKYIYPTKLSTLYKDSGGKYNIYNFTLKDGERDYPTLYSYKDKFMRTFIFHGDENIGTEINTFQIYGKTGLSISKTINLLDKIVGSRYLQIKKNLANKDIFLNVCYGGRGGSNSLAQRLADKYNVTVVAASGRIELGSKLVSHPGLPTTDGKWYIYRKQQAPQDYITDETLKFIPNISGKFTKEEVKSLILS